MDFVKTEVLIRGKGSEVFQNLGTLSSLVLSFAKFPDYSQDFDMGFSRVAANLTKLIWILCYLSG